MIYSPEIMLDPLFCNELTRKRKNPDNSGFSVPKTGTHFGEIHQIQLNVECFLLLLIIQIINEL